MRSGFLVALFVAQLLGQKSTAESAEGTITVEISALRVEQGWELCFLYASADGFPAEISKATQHARVPIHAGQAVCDFSGVKPGVYAVSVMRDENGDGMPAKDFFDIPKSGVGASNDAKGFLTLPKFDDAKFTYSGGALRIPIKMTNRVPR